MQPDQPGAQAAIRRSAKRPGRAHYHMSDGPRQTRLVVLPGFRWIRTVARTNRAAEHTERSHAGGVRFCSE